MFEEPGMLNVLLLEDEMLIALDLELTLRELGADEVYPVATVSQAITALESGNITGAIVDYNLGGETSEPVLMELEARKIPFVVMSGYPDSSYLGDGTRDWPMLPKPAGLSALREVLASMKASKS
ncbi:CheY-like chemotaxis protein [Sphingobium sp. B2D3A]|uniref:hypothetical protein n=2 Tax=Sphingobium TaxID=165695 RepID=UPI002224F569|nr:MULTISPECIES: hypothetical protein [unclassified Sphingobium]MCW2337139.1 CheY-like chemotaxis protein [Sphingobium sp. B2D3A]MCW2380999.1 CheY-like chemotaxis protein [Sphingobium sp. B2D3B]MCW2383597.1 CheY-like chemotaxis protein [Sphingobium sp. B2D3D]MCW2393167.1 CheY-like chemotaxis protein [Sphingobium sp. B11D3A]MCW2395394.1 CheY-like chemotaxis protein [Sphingobium sp. B8D3B]